MTTKAASKITEITKQQLANCLAHFERFAGTYFWRTPSDANSRRQEEKRNSREWTFKVDGQEVVASVKVTCSIANYYATRRVLVNGVDKKMMIPYLRKLIDTGVFEV